MTYQEVYLLDDLTIEAKAIYGMLCSYAGTGAEAYPSVEFMCSKLHISRPRFYKHMHLLVEAGVVEKKTKRQHGFANNLYTLIPNVQSVHTQNMHIQNVHTQIECEENSTTNNNSTNNNSININRSNNVCPEPENPAPDLSGILLSLNDNSKYDVPLSKIEKWAVAYPAVNIEQELRKMATWLDANRSRRKTKRGIDRFIINWLSRQQDKGRSYTRKENVKNNAQSENNGKSEFEAFWEQYR